MTFAALPPDVRAIAERVLTPKQLEAWQFEQAGWGMTRIARRLGVTKGAIVSRLDGANLKLRKAGVRMDEFGQWYFERDEEAA
jgi:transcriptional regulator